MKKLFTLLALLTCFLGANATEVVDVDLDFSTQETLWGWGHGWVDGKYDSYFDLDNGCLHFHNEEAQANNYDFQLQPFPSANDVDAIYTVTIKLKGAATADSPEKRIWLSFGGSETPGWCEVPADFQEFVFTNVVNDPNAPYFANSNSILLQCGHFVGEFWIASVKITHDEKEPANPITWIDMIKNGDASAPWDNPNAQTVNNQYDGEGAQDVCAYSKEYGYNDNNPHAAFISEDGVFYTTTVPVEDDPDGASEEWQNQFWINFPRPLMDGEPVRLSFRYKASQDAKAPGQGHRAPGDYLGGGIGDITFTTDWQPFESTFDATGGMQSIAFNLGANNQYDKEITFYFDDIKLEYQQLEEGWFVAAANPEDGSYDFDNAIKFEEAGDDFVATVGGQNEDEWVKDVMISTARGTDKGFRSHTIKVDTESPIQNDPEDWHGWEAKGKSTVTLPVRGMWKIRIANSDENLISFEKLAGEEDIEPIDIVTNESELVIEGAEREDMQDSQGWNGLQINEEPDSEDGSVGGEGHTGQAWDNQFWIVANRTLPAGTVTVIKFKYKASKGTEEEPVKASTQCHNEAGQYIHWAAIGDVMFTTEWQDFEKEFTIPNECDGKEADGGYMKDFKSIAFNMAEIREACNYEIKDVQWYLKYGEEGKTTENLINADGTENFWVKIGAGTDAYQWGNKPAEFSPYDIDQNGEVTLSDVRKIINKWKAGEEGYNLAFARKAIIEWKK